METDPRRLGAIPASGLILSIVGVSDAVFSVVAAFLADDGGHFVAEVEKIEL